MRSPGPTASETSSLHALHADTPELDAPDFGSRYGAPRPLGQGTGGSVWIAADRLLDCDVAIKLLPPSDGSREFRALRLLAHPGTVRVLDVGVTEHGNPWFSMEWVRGVPFGAPEGPPLPDPVLALARLLEVIGFVHDRGWVHGDIKSDNVLIVGDEVRLLDFGLALGRTDTRDLRGTLGFMAPEVLSGSGVSPRSDLYAVGVLGWLALAGCAPFPEGSTQPGLGADEDGSSLPRAQGRQVTAAMRHWLAGLLQRDPALRPSSAEEALASLQATVARDLRDPADAVARLAPTPPVGRTEDLATLQRTLARGGRAIVAGDPGSGVSFLLAHISDSRRATGARVRALDLSGDAAESWTTLAQACGAEDVGLPAPAALSDADPDARRAALALHSARSVHAVRSAMRLSAALWVLDGLDPDTLAGSTVLAAASAEPGVPMLVGTSVASCGPVCAGFPATDQPPVVTLAPWSAGDIVDWLGLALGVVHAPSALAGLLLGDLAGLPAAVVRSTRSLLRCGALFRGAGGWEWTEDHVVAELETLRTTASPGGPAALASARAVVDAAQTLVDRGEVRAARRLLDAGIRSAHGPSSVHFERLRLSARVHGLLGQHAAAAETWAQLAAAPELPAEQATDALLCEATSHREAAAPSTALSLLDRLGTPCGDEQAYRAARERASCHQALGAYEDARVVASGWLESHGAAAPVERRAAIEIVLANCEWQTGHPAAADARCARLLTELPSGLTRPRASASTTRGTALWRLGRHDEAAACFATGAELFEAAGSLLDAARVSNNLGILRYSESDWHGAIAAFERFRSLVSRLGNEGEVASAANNLGVLYRDTGQLIRAGEALDEALRLSRRLGLARLEAMVLGNLAETAALAGRGDDAERLYADAIAIAAARDIVDEQIECWRRLAQRRIDDRAPGEVEHALSKARDLATSAGATSELVLLDGLSAVHQLRTGSVADAIQAADAAVAALLEQGNTHEAARLQLRVAEALSEHGRDDDAAELLDLAEPPLRALKARPELARLEPLRQRISAIARNRQEELSSHLSALQELTLALSREMDLDRLLVLILERTLDLVGFDRGYVLLMDDAGDAQLKATYPAADPDGGGPSTSVLTRVIDSQAPLVSFDLAGERSLGNAASITAAQLRSVICVPIRRGEQLLGLLYVDAKQVLGGAADAKVALLTACADAASVAIENARLVDALRRKNDSLAILAHELRTPLSAIIGLASEALNDEGQTLHHLAQVKAQGQRMNRMIDQVLSVARMEAGKADWRREIVDPLELIVQARDTIEPIAAQAGIRLEADLSDDAPETVGDLDRLIQVLVNLLGNATKFAPSGGLVTIAASRADDGGLRLVVDDDGPGIPEERLRAIFEPYEQAGDRSMRQRGVGLGLAISRRIVAEHGGRLSASNLPTGGARFELVLPNAADCSEVPS